MSLGFILGNSGSGKSYEIYKEIISKSVADPTNNIIILVPEQFTLQTQKDLVMMHPNHAIMNVDILSFDRLAHRIFQELGQKSMEILDDTGKTLILRRVIEENKDNLVFFKKKLKQSGFVEMIKSMIAEFYQYGIDENQVEEILKASAEKPLLHSKLKDTAIIYSSFRSYLKDNYVTSEEILETLFRLLPKSEIIQKSDIYMDGFTGFTPIQFKVIEALLMYSPKLIISMTLDVRDVKWNVIKEHELFRMSKETLSKLERFAVENRIHMLPPLVCKGTVPWRFRTSSALACIERNIFREKIENACENPNEIQMRSAKNPEQEIEFAAGEIARLVREEGYRYRDIAVITGNIGENHKKIEDAFFRNGIPCFIDCNKNVLSNPLVEGMLSVIEVMEHQYSYESIFRYLKSGMGVLSREETDLLENYVLEWGIKGHKAWIEEWQEEMEPLRMKVATSLEKLFLDFGKKEKKIREYVNAIYEFIVDTKMLERSQNHLDYLKEDENKKIYEMVCGLFDQMVALLGEEEISTSEFRRILESGLSELELGLIPQTVDTVVAGDIQRTRLNNVRVLFMMNVNEGVVLQGSPSTGVISDKEREFLKEKSIELSPTSRESLFIQKYYLYLSLTKPSEKLYLSFSRSDSEGKSLRPSYLIRLISKFLHPLEILEIEEKMNFSHVNSVETSFRYLAGELPQYPWKKIKNETLGLMNILMERPEYQNKVKTMILSVFPKPENSKLEKAVAQALFGEQSSNSVSRLERYANCAFSHFMEYGLSLKQRKEFQMENTDIGTIFHESIEMCSRKIIEMGFELNALPDNQRDEIVKESVASVAEKYRKTVLHSSARNKYLIRRIERITNRTIWAFSQHQQREKFRPAYFEKEFSGDLKGRIDRIDLYEDGDSVFVKVVDYKSGSKVFDLLDTYNNTQIQLVIYLDRAMKIVEKDMPKKNVSPGGLFYYNIKDPYIKSSRNKLKEFQLTGLLYGELEEKQVITDEVFKRGSNGLSLSQEGFTVIEKYVKSSISRMENEITQGIIEISPIEKKGGLPCDYCSYKAICNFDVGIFGYRERRCSSMDVEEILERMKETEDEDGV